MSILKDIKKIFSAVTSVAVETAETTETVVRSAHSLARAGEHYANSIEYQAEIKANIAKSKSLEDILRTNADQLDDTIVKQLQSLTAEQTIADADILSAKQKALAAARAKTKANS